MSGRNPQLVTGVIPISPCRLCKSAVELFSVTASPRHFVTELGAVMTQNPRTVQADSPFSLALQMMYEGGFRNVPVIDNGRPVGLVSARDALGPELKEFIYEVLRQEQTTDVLA